MGVGVGWGGVGWGMGGGMGTCFFLLTMANDELTRYCKSRIFLMHFILLYFICGGFRTKIQRIRKVRAPKHTKI